MRKGKISVKSENILPIIKKWLYSDKDIFLREVISNSSDAIYKLERLVSLGQYETDNNEYKIVVTLNKNKGTLEISDNGIGMTEQEVKDYIAQVAFSGAAEFVEKYKDKTSNNGIIGHFGLGFYSVFMVSDLVEINTLSYKQDAKAVQWICDGSSEYKIGLSRKNERGTSVILHISEDSKEFLDEYKIREIIKKYCSFISYDIIFIDDNREESESDKLNTIKPIWLKNAKDCSDEEYKKFYRDIFNDYQDPLFWIHLKVDSPFQLNSIVYFPRLRNETDIVNTGEIKLYYNQVFVADNIKEILPEFLMVLRGVIDCPDIPINVSRSALQNDGSVKQIANLISKKISDKLCSMFETARDKYIECWEDIHILLKYGCIRDQKFFNRIKNAIIFKSINGEYVTINEYIENIKDDNKKVVYYCDNRSQQMTNVELFINNNINVLDFSHPIDLHFAQEWEKENPDLKFVCVTSEIPDEISTGQIVSENELNKLVDVFRKALNNDKIVIKAEYLKEEKLPLILSYSEELKRYDEIKRNFNVIPFEIDTADNYIITVNRSNSLINRLLNLTYDEKKNDIALILCKQLYMAALMSLRQLSETEKQEYIDNSYFLFDLVI